MAAAAAGQGSGPKDRASGHSLLRRRAGDRPAALGQPGPWLGVGGGGGAGSRDPFRLSSQATQRSIYPTRAPREGGALGGTGACGAPASKGRRLAGPGRCPRERSAPLAAPKKLSAAPRRARDLAAAVGGRGRDAPAADSWLAGGGRGGAGRSGAPARPWAEVQRRRRGRQTAGMRRIRSRRAGNARRGWRGPPGLPSPLHAGGGSSRVPDGSGAAMTQAMAGVGGAGGGRKRRWTFCWVGKRDQALPSALTAPFSPPPQPGGPAPLATRSSSSVARFTSPPATKAAS